MIVGWTTSHLKPVPDLAHNTLTSTVDDINNILQNTRTHIDRQKLTSKERPLSTHGFASLGLLHGRPSLDTVITRWNLIHIWRCHLVRSKTGKKQFNHFWRKQKNYLILVWRGIQMAVVKEMLIGQENLFYLRKKEWESASAGVSRWPGSKRSIFRTKSRNLM